MTKIYLLINSAKQAYSDLNEQVIRIVRPGFKHGKKVRSKRSTLLAFSSVLIIGMIAGLSASIFDNKSSDIVARGNLTDTIEQVDPVNIANTNLVLPGQSLNWPAKVTSSVGIAGSGVIASSHSESSVRAIASVTKVMTAIAVLEKTGLEQGDQGPKIVFGKDDVDIFNYYISENGSVTEVKEGDSMSLYNALQTILIKSSNNMSDTLVNAVFGNMDNFLEFASDKAEELGLDSMVISDASGLSEKTKSSPQDLIRLGEYALENPVFAEIVAKWRAEIPGLGELTNSNKFVDYKDTGVIGIKSGYTEKAGGTFLVAAERRVHGQDIIIMASVLGTDSHFQAQEAALKLIEETEKSLRLRTN